MKFLLIFSILLPLGVSASAPVWFSDYVKNNPGCEHEYICVAAEGETLADALSEARLEAAKFFQTTVKGKSQLSNSSQQKGSNIDSASFDEWTSKTITEETNEMISGLELKRQEIVSGHVFVLMSLDRAKTGKSLREKIESLDTENANKFALNSRLTYPKIIKNLNLIEAYLDRYNLLDQSPLKIKVKKEDLQQKISHLQPLRIALISVDKKLPAKLQHTLIDLLSPLKIVIVSKRLSPKYTIRSEILTEEQYFKVDGFKKLNIILKLQLMDRKLNVLGKLSAFSEQVGRTTAQTIEKALPEIKESVEKNLDQLSTIKMED